MGNLSDNGNNALVNAVIDIPNNCYGLLLSTIGETGMQDGVSATSLLVAMGL